MKAKETRGKTAQGRLRLLDDYLARYERDLLAKPDDAVFVDVGFGEYPWTTLEAARAFRELNPELAVVGVENDARRVENAREYADADTRFVLAGFELADTIERPARLVRAMNVLRQYPFDEVDDARRRWSQVLCGGGLLVEGTSDKHGHILTAWLFRRRGEEAEREALVFATDFERGFAPMMFRDWLPRDIRRKAQPGTAIRDFLDTWTEVFDEVRAEGIRQPVQAFEASVERLASCREDAVADAWMASHGHLVWRPHLA
ncbi:methylase [Persicimonas caeni]|uniref:Methylase n=1 Tax=Persicimonas caeni TaxID=2292766 RepID=A0A4Y6PMJ7_PERCE|nr:methylase [Persicimonas caeni]QDG49480.1 methylase [Persicimonas caeni]QED30701.1 methylase [Persicimonas caeni]